MNVEEAAGSETASLHEVRTYIIIWRVSSLSGDVRTGVDCPIRALEGESAPWRTKSLYAEIPTFGKVDVWEDFNIKLQL